MNASAGKAVREVAVEVPEATRVFDNHGIDRNCGQNRSLEQRCIALNHPVDEVMTSPDVATHTAHTKQPNRNWQEEPLVDLIRHIIATHHKYTRQEVGNLKLLLQEVCSVRGKMHPEIEIIQNTFDDVAQELSTHL